MGKWTAVLLLTFGSVLCTAQKNTEKINWLTLEEVNLLSKEEPKQILVYLYTNWCTYCKKMDKTSFKNKEVINYINKHFYAVKINAEQRDPLLFQGQLYGPIAINARRPINALVHEWMRGNNYYPCFVFFDDHYQKPVTQPGYLDLSQLEQILKYRASKAYKTTNFLEFSATLTPEWK